ncbi:MAG: hypothetical protein H0U67_07920, partial [Gemmatimonadetes bacterium]|nr:hypothetical protein [Gemmatimonadota bacterium]
MKNSTARRYSTPDADTPEVSGGRLRLTVMPREMLDRVSLADLADEKLFERYQDGDESAFSLIVQR